MLVVACVFWKGGSVSFCGLVVVFVVFLVKREMSSGHNSTQLSFTVASLG